jgi:hypothetical protein
MVSDWLQGLASMGCTFMELIPGTKRTRKPWVRYSHQVHEKGLSSALAWLKKGSGVGILPTAPLWILDVDSAELVERQVSTLLDAGIIPLMVKTPSGGAHFYFRFPGSFRLEGLKNHVCHPRDDDGNKLAMDFKLGSRTLLVAPGTARKGKAYTPEAPWSLPPVVDPRMFLAHGKFWREHRPFRVDSRPLKDRIARACAYLGSKAPVSVSGKSGHKVLAGVTAHLVAYLGLDPELAHHLLTHGANPWNNRCVDVAGNPFPWNDGELWAACSAAVDALPAAGVKAWDREQAIRERKMNLTTRVKILKSSLTLPASHRVPVERVRRAFEWIGNQDLSATALGDALVAQDVKRVLATRAHIQCIPKLDGRAMVGGLLKDVWVRFVDTRREEVGSALMKQVRSGPVPSQLSTTPVPSQLSAILENETRAMVGEVA